ncbi:MAG: hypothetical protein KJZ93_18145 [Caldilineaceae bacterium]|nr:hypothetical protein [Caldilineaceae bacterium]
MWYNAIITALLRSPLHRMVSSGILLVSYIGHKSGRPFHVPVSYVPDDEEPNVLWTTSLRTRTWWRNFREETPVLLRLRGKRRKAMAEAFYEEDDAAEALFYFLQLKPEFARHFDVALDEEGEPVEEDVTQAAKKRIVVRFDLVD